MGPIWGPSALTVSKKIKTARKGSTGVVDAGQKMV